MITDRFEVVRVPFPFTDSSTTKTRPALVVSNAEFNHSTGKTLFAMITSSTKTAWLHDTEITDLKMAGLTVSCCIRMKLFTIDNRFVVRRLGRLSAIDSSEFGKNFNRLTLQNRI